MMVNDITTLNGSLSQLGETLASNITQKGVTASASDGLTTLANKVLDIQTGGSCYHIEFSEDSYVAVGGSVVLECSVQQNYAPLGNVTVTLSDGSSVYSSITNSQGVAEFNLTGLTSSATWTCSYSNVTDTCTVTVSSYLFSDDASVDNSSTLFGDNLNLRNGGTSTVNWNSDGYYLITQTGNGKESMRVLNALTGYTGSFVLEYDSYCEQNGGSSGFVIYNSGTNWVKLTDNCDGDKTIWYGYNTGSFTEVRLEESAISYMKWIHYKYTIDNGTFRMEIFDGDTCIFDHTVTYPSSIVIDSNTKFGIDSEWSRNTKTRYKNLVAYGI